MKGEKLRRNLLFIICVMVLYNIFFGGSDNSLYLKELHNQNEKLDSIRTELDFFKDAHKDTALIIEKQIKEIRNNYFQVSNEVDTIYNDSVLVARIRLQLQQLGTANFNSEW